MIALFLGLGYVGLAAVGAACWGLALASAGRASGRGPSSRTVGILVAGGLAALVVRVVVVVVLAQRDAGFVQEKVVVGLPLSAAASIVAALAWFLPRQVVRPLRREGLTAGAMAVAAAAAIVEVLLTVAVGAPVGAASAVAALAAVAGTGAVAGLVRVAVPSGAADSGAAPSDETPGPAPVRAARRPALAAGAAAAAVILGVGVVGFLGSTGAGALQAGGYGPVAAHGHGTEPAGADSAGRASGARSVTDLTTAPAAPGSPGATVEVELAAQQQSIDLPSGRSIQAWTFGALAGPALVARVGDTLAVRVTDVDIAEGTTVHWHGYPVANAFDGVAGVTQDAVRPGEEFRAEIPMTRPGTYWYHTHQRGSQGVVRGLYGTLVVHPASGPTEDVDLVLPVHTFSGTVVVGTSDMVGTSTVAPGRSVRLRLVNTDQVPQTFAVQGAPFRVVALDGTEVDTGILHDRALVVAAGGRVDVVLEMPDAPVRAGVASDRDVGLALVPHAGVAVPDLTVPPTAFDPVGDLAAPSGATSAHADADAAIDAALAAHRFDVERTLLLDRLPRLVQGAPDYGYTVDGRVYPFIEPTVVAAGDVVRLRFVNRSFETHPMHPHGHSVRVLSVDGRAPMAPLWLDTFDVGPGEVWEVALYADNPGIWMDHCHNLEHAALGMVTHLVYRGVTTPFEHGGRAGNAPE